MNERTIFENALDLHDPAARAAYIAAACGRDAQLQARVAALLDSHEEANSFLQGAAVATIDRDNAPEYVGTNIGPYKIREQIGEGGMGVVYVAEQTEPVRRKVALKIIRPGMATKDVVARFEAERQALAMMDHPNIARVFDGGATGRSRDKGQESRANHTASPALDPQPSTLDPFPGQPYFVMELVQGPPITEYCDQQRLSTTERLKLFATVCRAVQHAHQKGIIHRDLKPSNVLVPDIDGTAVPKVIDFGVAKAVSQKLTEATVYTHFAQMVGTPLYMSPEQAGLGVVDIDTRSDVYSLGVLLYELLTGQTPFDSQTLKQAGLDEMQRIIREEEPRRPSAMVSTLEAAALSTVADRRGSDPRRFVQTVRGDLDWIVMKSLEKDRNRRYESASALAADIERYLAGEAVEACPPSTLYRVRKVSRRYRVAITTVTAIAVALLAGLAGTSWQAIRATRAEQAVREEASVAQAVVDFVNVDLLAQANPENEPDRDIRLRDVIDRAAKTVGARFNDQPVVDAAIRHTLGEMYASLGDYKQAEEHHKRARVLRLRELGQEHPSTLSSAIHVAAALLEQARFSEAEKLYRATLATQRRVLGDEHPDTLKCMHGLANLAYEQGHYVEAEEQYRKVFNVRRRVLGEEHFDTLHSRHGLATAIDRLGRHVEAEQLHRDGLETMQRVMGAEHPRTQRALMSLATTVARRERWTEAETLCREVLDTQRSVLGDEHPDTLQSMSFLALVMRNLGRPDEAEELYRTVLKTQQRVLGAEHPATLGTRQNLSFAIRVQGRHDEAEELLREVLELSRQVLGHDHHDTIDRLSCLAMFFAQCGRFAEAEPWFWELLNVHQRVNGEEHPDSLNTSANLASIISEQGRYQEAEKLLWEVLELQRRSQGDEHPDTIQIMANLAFAIRNQERLPEAEALYRELLIIKRRLHGDQDSRTLFAINDLASVVSEDGAKQRLYQEMLELEQRMLEDSPNDTILSQVLAVQYAWLGRQEQHVELCSQLLSEAEKSTDPNKLDRAAQLDRAAKSWLIRPAAESPLTARAIELARRAFQLEPQQPWLPMGAGIAAYRSAKYDEAIALLTKGADHAAVEIHTTSRAFLAMAHFRQGDIDQARRVLAANQEHIDHSKAKGGIMNADRLISWMAHQEAQELLGGDTINARNETLDAE